jgi:Flp pilus assembly pilin Flp
MIDTIKKMWSDEEGLTTVEYALLLALLVVAAVAVWTTFGRQVQSSVSTSSTSIANAMNG